MKKFFFMKNFFLLGAKFFVPALTLAFLLGCPPLKPGTAAAEAAGENTGKTAAPAPSAEAPVRLPRFSLSSGKARPGEPVTIGCADIPPESGRLSAALVRPDGERLAKSAFFALPREEGEAGLKAAILAIPSTAAPGEALIRVESPGGVLRDIPFTIEHRDFVSETIPLNPSNTNIRVAPDPQKTVESEQLWAILSRTGTEIYSSGIFLPPVSSTRRTSFYGDRRVYEYSSGAKDTSIHAGVDYGVPKGTEVRSCGRGKVVLARSRIVTGNSVVIEHLPGLYSLYYHLETIAVSEGSIVEAGALLGGSGSTGLSTGPHLHWEIRVSGENTDPDALLLRPLLDKKDIVTKMENYE